MSCSGLRVWSHTWLEICFVSDSAFQAVNTYYNRLSINAVHTCHKLNTNWQANTFSAIFKVELNKMGLAWYIRVLNWQLLKLLKSLGQTITWSNNVLNCWYTSHYMFIDLKQACCNILLDIMLSVECGTADMLACPHWSALHGGIGSLLCNASKIFRRPVIVQTTWDCNTLIFSMDNKNWSQFRALSCLHCSKFCFINSSSYHNALSSFRLR